jgi:hypothetical protein
MIDLAEVDVRQAGNLSFKLHPDDLSFIGANNKPVIDHGEFEVMIGRTEGQVFHAFTRRGY